MMARYQDMSRMSMSWLIAGGMSDDREQAALLAHLHGDRARADAVEDLARDRLPAPCRSGAASSTSAAV